MDIETLEKLIKSRRSIRKWKQDEVQDELLKKAVELATWAPNGGNFQGWRFVVVKKREVIEKMADALQFVSDKIASWPEASSWEEDINRYRGNVSFFRNAPACIAVFTAGYQSVMDKVLMARESFDPEATRIMGFRRSAPTAIQSAAAAVTTMLLVFHHMGLGAVWLGAPLMAKKEIETLTKAPENLSLVCLVAVGYADELPQKDRKPVDQVLEFIR
ncbi:MAG: nitroreductase family protein [Thermodesulfobacteriota bacterium]|nr:nitroreductase family protein [Thermodesulfobacteriota bacterium]